MANPFSAKKKAKEKKANPFGRNKPAKKKGDEIEPGPDGVYGIQINEEVPTNPWAKSKFKARVKAGIESDKHDYTVDGLRICHVREHDGFWTIEVVNNDETVRFDNKTIHPWGITLTEKGGKEAAPFLTPILQERWYQELKRQGRETPLERHLKSVRAPVGPPKEKAEKPKKSGGKKKDKTNPFGRKKVKA